MMSWLLRNDPAPDVRQQQRKSWVQGIALLSALCGLSISLPAQAVGTEKPAAEGKGLVGGALLGAEVTVFTEAAFGVEPVWAYAVGAGAGAVAGGIGGYAASHASGAELGTAFFVSGLVLAVPTLIYVLHQRSYHPDEMPNLEPTSASDPGQTAQLGPAFQPPATNSEWSPSFSNSTYAGKVPALFQLTPELGLHLNLPDLEVVESIPRRQQVAFGLKSEPEFRLSLMKLEF